MIARKAENLSNSYLFLQRITFTKFLKGISYITLIDARTRTLEQRRNLEIQAGIAF